MARPQPPRLLRHGAIRFFELVLKRDIEAVELFSATAAMLWGAWVLNPSMQTFAASPTFAGAASRGPEWAWGVLFLALGAAQSAVLILDVIRWRQIVASFAVATWTYLSVLVATSVPESTATVIYPLFALAAAWTVLRLERDSWTKAR